MSLARHVPLYLVGTAVVALSVERVARLARAHIAVHELSTHDVGHGIANKKLGFKSKDTLCPSPVARDRLRNHMVPYIGTLDYLTVERKAFLLVQVCCRRTRQPCNSHELPPRAISAATAGPLT